MDRAELIKTVRHIVEAAQQGIRNEADLIELKSDWVDPRKFARQFAGMCNAARGEDVLLIVGLDENTRAVCAVREEPSDWVAQLRTMFDGEAPRPGLHERVAWGDAVVHAIMFGTTDVPYVVRTLDKQHGNSQSLEVPMRCAGGTRSATRDEIIALSEPFLRAPQLKIVSGHVQDRMHKPNPSVAVSLSVYCTPRSRGPVALSAHRLQIVLLSGESPLQVATQAVFLSKSLPPVAVNAEEILVDAPGTIDLKAQLWGQFLFVQGVHQLGVRLEWTAGGTARASTANAVFAPIGPRDWRSEG